MFFKMKDRKYWITEVPVFDPQIDKESTEIWDWIHDNGLYGKLCNKMGWRQNHNDPYDVRKKVIIDNMSKKEMREYINTCIDNDIKEKELLERYELDV